MNYNSFYKSIFAFIFSTVHRDLKTANVLVNGDELHVADLGQARVHRLSDDLSLLSM